MSANNTELARIKLKRVAAQIDAAKASDKYSGEYSNVDREALARIRERRAQKAAAQDISEIPKTAGEYCIVYGQPDDSATSTPQYTVSVYNHV